MDRQDEGGRPDAVSYDELRNAPRFSLLIRSAKLICESGEYLCIIRDVSMSGIRLKMFHPIPTAGQLQLELSTGDRFLVEAVWERDGHAGFRFCDAVDVQRFIDEASPFPKRALRLKLEFPATLCIDSAPFIAKVCDLSRQGAKVQVDQMLAIGQKVRLEAQGMPAIMATVCWRATPFYGLSFQQTFTFEELAIMAHRFQSANASDPSLRCA